MATLTETAYYARKAITYGIVGLVVFLLLKAILGLAITTYRRLNPPPPPPPTVEFGKLPALIFPETSHPALTYRLETVTGTTPDLVDRATVYFMPVRQPNLLALERMTALVSELDFTEEPEQLSGRQYRWARTQPLPATLTADVVSGSFSLEVAWEVDQTLLVNKNLPNQTQAINEAERFLQGAGLLQTDLLAGETTVSFLRADIATLVPTVSLSEADFVRVDFFRAPVEELLVYPAKPQRGIVSLTFSGNRTVGKRVVELKYNYFSVDYEQIATYPLKTSAEAFSELKVGQGFVAQVDPGVEAAVVRQVVLGYYDSSVPQHYLQPIFVFTGDNNFIGYVAAIASEWIE